MTYHKLDRREKCKFLEYMQYIPRVKGATDHTKMRAFCSLKKGRPWLRIFDEIGCAHRQCLRASFLVKYCSRMCL